MAIGQVTCEITDDVQLATQIVLLRFQTCCFSYNQKKFSQMFPVSVNK